MQNGQSSRARVVKKRQQRNKAIKAGKFGKKNKLGATAGSLGALLGFTFSGSPESGQQFNTKQLRKRRTNRNNYARKAKFRLRRNRN